MKICVFGVARSGTTAIYALLQHMMLDRFGEQVSFSYEPFLREKKYFNAPFKDVVDRFNYVESISIEAVQAHLKIPLFVSEPDPYLGNQYLKDVFQKNRQGNVLFKFIRAAGRYLLLKELCPDCLFVFTIRNPVDSVYSAMSKFSYYGGEFHRDDYPRFLDEINRHFGSSLSVDSFPTRVEKESAFWYYMNKFAFRTFSECPEMPLIICYEDYAKRTDYYVQMFCRLLDMDYKPEYHEVSETEVGPITREFVISSREREVLGKYMAEYTEMLKSLNERPTVDPNDVWSKYSINENAPERENPFYGYHGLYIKRQYDEIAKTTEGLKELSDARLNRIAEAKEKLREKEEAIFSKEEKLRELRRRIDYLEQMRSEAQAAREQVKDREELLAQKEADRKAMEKEILELKERISDVDRIKKELEETRERIRKNAELLLTKEQNGKRKEQEIKELQRIVNELSGAREELASARDQLVKREKLLKEVEKRTSEMERALREREEIIRKQKSRLEQKAEQIQRKEEKILQLSQAWKRQRQESDRMTQQYDREREKREEMTKKIGQIESQWVYRLMKWTGLLK